ncbi:MAG: MerR family transcriptional regulator, partial [Rhodococcus sp. (in: high G+C Gram-positive bacteria)]
MEYRIDDLAHAAGTTTRNVRAYRERGLLPPPEKRGRIGIYDDVHLSRLRLIDVRLQRGFTTSHISDFITGWENGKDLAEVLGLQNAVTEQWSNDEVVEIP